MSRFSKLAGVAALGLALFAFVANAESHAPMMGQEGAEALIVATEWSEFANVDLALVKERMATPIVFDGRNLLDPETMAKLGFHYHSIGRKSVIPG